MIVTSGSRFETCKKLLMIDELAGSWSWISWGTCTSWRSRELFRCERVGHGEGKSYTWSYCRIRPRRSWSRGWRCGCCRSWRRSCIAWACLHKRWSTIKACNDILGPRVIVPWKETSSCMDVVAELRKIWIRTSLCTSSRHWPKESFCRHVWMHRLLQNTIRIHMKLGKKRIAVW